jgi:hypothetical protein
MRHENVGYHGAAGRTGTGQSSFAWQPADTASGISSDDSAGDRDCISVRSEGFRMADDDLESTKKKLAC